MKILLIGFYHHKNEQALLTAIKLLGWTRVHTINDADIVMSANQYVDIAKYPNKKFIFGPHFSVFPNDVVKQFNNIYKNAIYIQPSKPTINTWLNEFKYTTLPVHCYSFGVDTKKFTEMKPITERKQVFVYYKSRKPEELCIVTDFLRERDIDFVLFDYNKKYSESTFLETLRNSKYGIWIGRHESQGFALQEALSCNVPLLVWNVRLRVQEYGKENDYKNITSPVTSIPYWDEQCGQVFYEQNELESAYMRFLQKLHEYKPREFVLDNLSMEKRARALNELISGSF